MHAIRTAARTSTPPAPLVPGLALPALCALLAFGIAGCAPAPESAPAPEAPASPREAPAVAEPPAPPPTREAPASDPPAPAAVEPPAAAPEAARPVPGPEARARLVGPWLRYDQSYMVVIDAAGEDGTLEARYLNPRPIHVSKAETWEEDGYVRLRLELTDRNYPGNYYELVYQPDQDLLVGRYYHLGNANVYQVYFTRFEDGEESPD